MLTILPNSNAVAIIPAPSAAPANNLDIPEIENTAAHTATNVAVSVVTAINDERVFIYTPRKRVEPISVRPVLFS